MKPISNRISNVNFSSKAQKNARNSYLYDDFSVLEENFDFRNFPAGNFSADVQFLGREPENFWAEDPPCFWADAKRPKKVDLRLKNSGSRPKSTEDENPVRKITKDKIFRTGQKSRPLQDFILQLTREKNSKFSVQLLHKRGCGSTTF